MRSMSVAAAATMLVVFTRFFTVVGDAQCALCKRAVEGGGGAQFARPLNLAILILLVPPVTIFCSIFVVAYKHRKGRDENSEKM